MRINISKLFAKGAHYLFAFSIILECRSIWTVTRGLEWFNDFNILLLAVSLICCILSSRIKLSNLKSAIIIVVFITIYMLLFWLFDSYKTLSFFKAIIMLIICIFYSVLFGQNKRKKFSLNGNNIPFWICYEQIMIVIACISLFFWMFGSCLEIFQPTGHIWSTWSTSKDTYVASYYGLYFETQDWQSVFSLLKYRNTAIFTEAPMASLNFSVALLIDLFIREKKSTRNLMILTAAIISTFSTTGYIVMILAYFAKLFFKEEKKTSRWIIKHFVVVIALIIGVGFIQSLIDQKLGTASGSIRLDDFSAGFKAWSDHPMLGNGYGNGEAITHYISGFRRNNTGYSNSPMYILALGGIYLFFPFLFTALKAIFRIIKNKDWNSLSFYSLFIVLFTITLIPFNGLTFIVFCMMGNYMKRQRTLVRYENQNRAYISDLGGLK